MKPNQPTNRFVLTHRFFTPIHLSLVYTIIFSPSHFLMLVSEFPCYHVLSVIIIHFPLVSLLYFHFHFQFQFCLVSIYFFPYYRHNKCKVHNLFHYFNSQPNQAAISQAQWQFPYCNHQNPIFTSENCFLKNQNEKWKQDRCNFVTPSPNVMQ